METSDWIAICSMIASVLITTIGSALYLSYKIGGSNEKLQSMSLSIDKLTNTVERITKEFKEGIAEIRIEMAEMKVKVNELWRDHVDRR